MIRNRNGYWMFPGFLSPDDGGTGGAAGAAGEVGAGDNGAGGEGSTPAGDGQNGNDNNGGAEDTPEALKAQLETMKAEIARQKEAINKATKEAAGYRRELDSKRTQAEIDEANKKEAEEKQAARLAELEKMVAKANNTKSVMAKLGVDEDTAGQIAESMVGCENIDNALLLIQKTWTAREKALKIEYGKIPGPGAGGGTEDKEMQQALELAKELGQRKAKNSESVRDQLKGLVR